MPRVFRSSEMNEGSDIRRKLAQRSLAIAAVAMSSPLSAEDDDVCDTPAICLLLSAVI